MWNNACKRRRGKSRTHNVHKFRGDSKLWKDIVELGERASVEILSGNKVVTHFCQIDNGVEATRRARTQSEPRSAPFQGRKAFFQDIRRPVEKNR